MMNLYELASKLAGPVEVELLGAQGIRSTYSLVHTEDVFDVLKYECEALNEIKEDACLRLVDNRYVVKPGCKSNMRYFSQLLKLKNQKNLKAVGFRMKSKYKSNNDDNSNIQEFLKL